ncbi:MAG: divalent cation transporter [Treponema sp.]|nr:MAG: divalent cation transporter [Treponema sp.]
MAGLPIIIGGIISSLLQKKDYKYKNQVNHFIVAFAGGALLSAIAFVLIPHAIKDMQLLSIVIVFLAGTLSFMILDIICGKIGGSMAQVLSMMMDFIPEALSLGASFAINPNFGLLIALFIGLQNLPEGFNSYIELRKKLSKKQTLLLLFALSFVGIIAALTGEYFLSSQKQIVDAIMLFSGGGILYLIFQDIAPIAKVKNSFLPASGANLGFLLGMIGEKLLN